MKLTVKELIKLIMSRECLTQKELISLLNEQTETTYNQPGFSRKLSKGTMTYNEVADILDILGYELEWKKQAPKK